MWLLNLCCGVDNFLHISLRCVSAELSEYTALVVRACDKAQLFANWFRLMIEVQQSS